jgi:crotonobetainyl-CoA:carnitine CoA-transferase CaiB-like acyl-CoA transferase
MSKPLEGIRVIELANFIAGPLAGTLLADMGADVIKVEPPTGDLARATPPIRNGESVSFAALNRNKRSLMLDLKQAQATEILMRLAGRCDVFLEAYRPGALEKLGVGAEAVKRANPRIVYTSVSGFGQSGPERRRAGVNLIMEAFSGALSVTGEPGKMPMRPGLQTADVFGALFATYATLSGLLGAARNGEGRIADVSLVEASIAAAVWETAEYLNTGNVPQPAGHRHRLAAPYQLFETRDGRYLAIGTPSKAQFEKFMRVLQLEAHLSDSRFSSYSSRKANEPALLSRSSLLCVRATLRNWRPLCPPPASLAALSTISRKFSSIRRSSPATWLGKSSIRGWGECAQPAIPFSSTTTGRQLTAPHPCWASIPRRSSARLVIRRHRSGRSQPQAPQSQMAFHRSHSPRKWRGSFLEQFDHRTGASLVVRQSNRKPQTAGCAHARNSSRLPIALA